jgi:signal transduction histidine kinase/Tfp pilus assembly protein PilF
VCVTLAVLLCGSAGATDGKVEDLERRLATAEGTERVALLNDLAVAVRGNAPDEAIDWADRALALAERIGDDAGRIRALNNLGVAHYFLSDYDAALAYYERSLELSERLGAKGSIADALNNIGIIHYVRGDYDRTLDYYSRSLQLRREIGDRTGLAKSYNNMGNVYHTAERYDESLEYYAESIAIYEEVGEEALVASSLNNIALVYIDLERYDEAAQRLERALEIGERVGHRPTAATTLNVLGNVADALGSYGEALDYHLRSLGERRALGDRRGEADSLLSIGRMHNNLGEFDRALGRLTSALELAADIGVRELERDAWEELAETHNGRRDYERALEAHRNFKRVHDELFDEEASRRLTELEARMDLQAKDREIEGLQARQRLQRLVRNASIASAVLLLLLIVLLYNRYRLSRKANEAQRQAQAAREKAARAELAHVSRVSTLGEMASALAHELNQPLTAILSNAETTRRLVAEDRATPEHLDEALEDVVTGAGRAREIIRRLRKLMRRGEVSREPLSINDVLRDVEAFARANVTAKGVRLELELDEGLPEVEGDSIQLQQVTLNLVNNAADAMGGAETSGSVSVRTERDEGGDVVVAVRDSGPPVDPRVVARMFEPFFTTKGDGLGMGLAICRTIIEAHGGRLWAEPNPDRGLTVRFALPPAGIGAEGPRTS